jgi:hypothetical protein
LTAVLRRAGASDPEVEVQNYLQWLGSRSPRDRWRASGRLMRRSLGAALKRLLAAGRLQLRRPSVATSSVLLRHRETRAPMGGYPRQYFFGFSEARALAAVAMHRWPRQVQDHVRSADKLLRGIFPLVSEVEADFSQGVDWVAPFEDQEHLFYLNRFAYAPVLAKASLYTGDPAYAEALVRLLEDWGRRNSPGHPKTWESYSVAERICNWIQTVHLLRAQPRLDGFLNGWLLPQLARHAAYLSSHLETTYMHNHLLNDGRALFIYGLCFPELEGAEACRDLGWTILSGEMSRQVRRDGMFREQSTHYHLLMTRTCTEMVWLALRNGHPVPEEMLRLLEKMHEAAQFMIRPDASISFVGDICPDIPSGQLVGILALGAVLFRRSDFKRPEALNEHALWYLGIDGLAAYDALEETSPARSGAVFDESGFAFLVRRSELPAHVMLHCDPVGRVIYHGDPDPLNIAIWLGDRDVIVDTGNYSYNPDEWLRYFKDPASQNTILVDGLAPWPGVAVHRWFGPEYGCVDAGVEYGVGRDGAPFVEGWHTGYHRLATPVTVRRRVTLEATGVRIIDRIEGAGIHDVILPFHLGPGQATVTKNEVVLSDERGGTVATFHLQSPAHLMVGLVNGWVATAYGVKRPAQIIHAKLHGRLPTLVETAVQVSPRAKPDRVRRLVASA